MKLPFTGVAECAPLQPVPLPSPNRARQSDPAHYLAETGLVDAVNVALMLGQPLLLTGEPGTGKTQLAHRIAWELGLGKPLVFDTKSTSTARDLFYTFDSFRRFHAANTPGAEQDNRAYIDYSALGLAILFANSPADVCHLLAPDMTHPGKRQSVVLIDEVDKAPRDFPNDLLNELEQMFFRITELGNVRVEAPADMRPVVIIASNSEKNLPDPFLRRCIYYHIPFPDTLRLKEILERRLDLGEHDHPMLRDVIAFFQELRERKIYKKPSTAELINWVDVLIRSGVDRRKPLKESGETARSTLVALLKNADDQKGGKGFVNDFFQRR